MTLRASIYPRVLSSPQLKPRGPDTRFPAVVLLVIAQKYVAAGTTAGGVK
jgi:hypothetical protein